MKIKSLKVLEASTGIEPVCTDLQSSRFLNEINAQALKKYQDKAGTSGEPDTRKKLIQAMKSPGALAGATGAETEALENLPAEHTAALVARHPIIATHWGIAA